MCSINFVKIPTLFIAFQTECTTHHKRAMLGFCRYTHGTTDPPSSWSLARAFSVWDRQVNMIREGTVNFCAYDFVTDQCTCADQANHGYSVVTPRNIGVCELKWKLLSPMLYIFYFHAALKGGQDDSQFQSGTSSPQRQVDPAEKTTTHRKYIFLLLNLDIYLLHPSPTTHSCIPQPCIPAPVSFQPHPPPYPKVHFKLSHDWCR